MLELLTRHWATVMVRGAAALIFGLTALIWPGITLLSLTMLFGAYALVDGAIAFGSAVAGHRAGSWAWPAAEGVAGILTGVVSLLWPGITAVALLWLIAAWAMATGVLRIATAVRLRREIHGEWLLVLSGCLSMLFGVLMVGWPAAGALAVVFLIGTYAIAAGVMLLVLGWRLRSLHRALPWNDVGHSSRSQRADAA